MRRMNADGGQAWLEQGQRQQVEEKNEEINEHQQLLLQLCIHTF